MVIVMGSRNQDFYIAQIGSTLEVFVLSSDRVKKMKHIAFFGGERHTNVMPSK